MNATENTVQNHIELAEASGFAAAAAEVKTLADRKRRLTLAYEHFRYVSDEKVQAFRKKLRAATSNGGHGVMEKYNDLTFEPVERYAKLPPADVLQKVADAKKMQVFDQMEVAYVVHIPDPIVFGRIDGCTDRFFIADWGTDVNIGDLLGENEG